MGMNYNVFVGYLTMYGPRVIGGVIILLVGWPVSKLLMAGLSKIFDRAGLDRTLAGFLTNLARVVILVHIVLAALIQFGVPAISFAAIVGAAGLAVGLALKGTLSNLASGVMLIAQRPFTVGDRIDVAGVSGKVSQIQVFATTIETEDHKRVIVPNNSIAKGNITIHP